MRKDYRLWIELSCEKYAFTCLLPNFTKKDVMWWVKIYEKIPTLEYIEVTELKDFTTEAWTYG